MFPGEFDYYAADSVAEAFDLLDDHPEAELIAGGHSLLPTMKSGLANPDALVDISRIDDLQGIDHGDGVTTIGAGTNYAAIADDDTLWENVPVFAEAASEVGDVQVRNRGTIGGNLAHSDPASDLPAAAIAADATIVVQGADGEREVSADDFFFGMYMTDVQEGELLTRVEFPHQGADATGAYVKKPSPASGYAMVGVAAALELDGDTVESARVAANGVMDHAVRLDPVEEAIAGETLSEDAFEDAAADAAADLDEAMMMDDIQASSEFRAQLLSVYAQRALESAAERSGAWSA
ncbi:MAG: xanthine dehydrogenase family protein subunit M [Haloarculaceae archaeon]